jgi:hypothetical protein
MAEFTATFKEGPGYDSAWIVIKAESAEQLADAIRDMESLGLDLKVRAFNRIFTTPKKEAL